MDITTSYGLGLVASIVFMTLIFLIARANNRYDLIDIAWGLSFIAIVTMVFAANERTFNEFLPTLILLLVLAWGFRLALHIYQRWSRTAHEDHRYVDMRKKYAKKPGGVAVNMYLKVFVVQAVLAVVICTPAIIVLSKGVADVSLLAWVGLIVWCAGFYFEAVGDYQLKQFIAKPDNKGRLMESGVWKYTRHPNYFGEITQWWGIYAVACAAAPALWWLSLIGPLTITILLVYISGVPLTERHFEGRKGWAEYKRRTSKLFPLPPKRSD